jgi:6-phosphofructokinase 1
MTTRIGLLTGGGDCPGLNAVIWSVVRAASEAGIEVIGIRDGFEGLVTGGDVVPLNIEKVRGIFARGGTMLGTTNRGNPFRYAASDGSERDRSANVVATIAKLGLDGVIAIGGDGTLAIAHELHAKGAPMIGVPKTIDNDLGATDTTFGFDTAVATACEALDRLKTTAESHDRIMLLEVMGRYAGWIALHSGIAGGAHCIVIPEIPYDLNALLAKMAHRRSVEQRNYTLVMVAEGAMPAGGETSHLDGHAPGHNKRLGGAAQRLEDALNERLRTSPPPPFDALERPPEIRTTVLGHVQRGGTPTAYDRVVSLRFGVRALELAAEGRWGRMVCLRGTQIEDVAIAKAVAKPHTVDPNGQLVRQARAVGICMG